MNKRIFILGSNWFYIKLYCGPKTLENILINDIASKLELLIDNRNIDQFFFIRYLDPDYHIRLRLHLENTNKLAVVIKSLKEVVEDYVENHIISKVIIDTYSREIERYGDKYICDVEKLFSYDSRFILTYLKYCNGDDTNRWLVSSKFIDLFLRKCGLTQDEMINFLEVTNSSFSAEIFSNNTFVSKQLNNKYRNKAKLIAATLEETHQQAWFLELNYYLEQIGFFTNRINQIHVDKRFSLLSSVIHMHINRMFRTSSRVNECVIYYLLLKYYKSRNARIKYQKVGELL